MEDFSAAYNLAQRAISDIKSAIHIILSTSKDGLTNAEIGRLLGIYHGHSGKHEGHISRVLLELMQTEGLIRQDTKTKKWTLRIYEQ